MKRLAALAVLLLAGCAPVPDASSAPAANSDIRAKTVILYRDTLTVEMSDRSLCTGRRVTQGNPWSGRLSGCPHPWPFFATRLRTRPRLPLASGGGGGVSVTLQTPHGAQIFSG